LTPAGSLFAGDAAELYIEVRPGARAELRQASATQLHGGTEAITFQATVEVGAGARFSYLPYELIPFAGADYRQSILLCLADGAEARLIEVVTPGRLWEHFRYERIALRTEVRLSRRRILLDAQRISPAETDWVTALAGYSHFGSLLRFGPGVGQVHADALHARFADLGVRGSASQLPCYGVGARLLGTSADTLLRALSCS